MNIQAQGKQIIIIAGPNGAGKTTFAPEYLSGESGCPVFVNADLIAEGLSPLQPADVPFCAGRLMLEQIKDHTRAGKSFAFETTLAGRSYGKSDLIRLSFNVRSAFCNQKAVLTLFCGL